MTARNFNLTEREQTLVMAALQRHWAANAGGHGLHETDASREISVLMNRLHEDGIASFVGPAANVPQSHT